MARKTKSQQLEAGQVPSGVWKVGARLESSNYANDPQSHKMAQEFADSPQVCLERLKALRERLKWQFEQHHGGCRWNPQEPFNYSTFAGDAGRTFAAWMAASHRNAELRTLDAEVFQTLVRMFEQMIESDAAAPDGLHNSFNKFAYQVDCLELLLSVSKKPPAPGGGERTKGNGTRRNAVRDSQWYDWRNVDGLTDAQIRDRWDRENPNDKVSRNNIENGLGIVASAITREESRRIQGTG